jgi:hypothetical protein
MTLVAPWIHEMLKYFEPEVIEPVRTAKSLISISFEGWGSKHEKRSAVSVVIHFINYKGENVARLIGLPEIPGHEKKGVGKHRLTLKDGDYTENLSVEQASAIFPLLERFGITSTDLGYFVLDNASNNNTTLAELGRLMDFDPIQKCFVV